MEELRCLDHGSGTNNVAEHVDGRAEGRDPDQGHVDVDRWRYQAHQHFGDDGERALAAGEQADQVVPDVVFRQSGPSAKHGPVGEHRLDAEHLCAGRCRAGRPAARRRSSRQPRPMSRTLSLRGRCPASVRRGQPRAVRRQPSSRPAPNVRPTGSTESMVFNRRRLRTTSPSAGTDAPTRPVLPPCGTSETPAAAQARTTSATSAVDAGTDHRRDRPTHRPVQSVR